jgi:hypothetical protein
MESRILPPSAEINARIADCEVELKSLRRLLRMSRTPREAARHRLKIAAKFAGINAPTLPSPDELRQRIADCEIEIKSLRRLLRMSWAWEDANAARHRRKNEEVSRASS